MNHNKLIQKTAEVLFDLGLQTLPEDQITENSCWSKICQRYMNINKFCKIKCLDIRKRWIQNTLGYRNKVHFVLKDMLKNKDQIEKDDNINDDEASSDSQNVATNECFTDIGTEISLSKSLQKFIINVSESEWFDLKTNLRSKSEKYFLNEFTERLTRSLNKQNINCNLGCIYNAFSTAKKYNTQHYWRGSYFCTKADCAIKYSAKIFKKPGNKISPFTTIEITTDKKCNHGLLNSNVRLSGTRRLQQGESLLRDGVTNTITENVLKNCVNERNHIEKGLPQLPHTTDRNTLNVLKSYMRHVDKLSLNIYQDTKSAKNIYDTMHRYDHSVLNKGFLFKIGMDPFGFLMLHEKQLKMWAIVSASNPVWYFDATGSVIPKIRGCGDPFLYSIVFHDKINKFIFPVVQFMSTGHDQIIIAEYLNYFKYKAEGILQQSCDFKIAPIIVTDFSWALINSIMFVFNNCNMTEYINWCFNEIFEDPQSFSEKNRMKSKLCLCSVHFLKMIIKRVRKIAIFKPTNKTNCQRDKLLQNTFISLFTLLQEAIKIEEFKDKLKHMYNIFNIKKYNKIVNNSTNYLKKDLLQRGNDLQNEIASRNLSVTEKQRARRIRTLLDDNGETSRDLKKKSPFTIYFDALLKDHIEAITRNQVFDNDDSLSNNPFFAPQVFQIILDYVHILPLWTKFVVRNWKELYNNEDYNISERINNQLVENWFGQLKHNILLGNVVYPSEFSAFMHKKIEADYQRLYKNKRIKVHMLKDTGLEKWKDKNKRKRKKERSYYDCPVSDIFSDLDSNKAKTKRRSYYSESDFEKLTSDEDSDCSKPLKSDVSIVSCSSTESINSESETSETFSESDTDEKINWIPGETIESVYNPECHRLFQAGNQVLEQKTCEFLKEKVLFIIKSSTDGLCFFNAIRLFLAEQLEIVVSLKEFKKRMYSHVNQDTNCLKQYLTLDQDMPENTLISKVRKLFYTLFNKKQFNIDFTDVLVNRIGCYFGLKLIIIESDGDFTHIIPLGFVKARDNNYYTYDHLVLVLRTGRNKNDVSGCHYDLILPYKNNKYALNENGTILKKKVS